MKAIQISEFGDAQKMQLADLDIPAVNDGEVLVKLEYSGVNYIDVYMRDGTYAKSHTYQTPLPLTLGMEGGGVVVESKSGEFKTGDRVAFCLHRGSYAEFVSVPSDKLVLLPDDITMQDGTTLMLQGLTAHYLSHSAFPLATGHSCLIHAGAGGVGQLLIQLAKRAGATVIATVGSETKRQQAISTGADHCIVYTEQDFATEVSKITDGIGVNVVYDSVGKSTLRSSLSCLKKRGVCVNYGASSGQAEPVAPLELAEAGSVFLTRPHLADYIDTPAERNQRAQDLFDAVRKGQLKTNIHKIFNLSEAAVAHQQLENRQSKGKFLLSV